MKLVSPLAASVAFVLASVAPAALAADNLEVKTQSATGAPVFVTGNFGLTAADDTVSALKQVLAGKTAYQANGNEDFVIRRQWVDKLGKRHTHVNQTINGLTVYGTSLIVHANLASENNGLMGNHSKGQIYAISGALALNNEQTLRIGLLQSSPRFAEQARSAAATLGELEGEAELAYIFLPLTGETKLAFKQAVTWNHGGDNFGHDTVFVDAHSNEVLARHAHVHSAKNWKTYSLDNQNQNAAPGRLLCTNTQSCGDASGQRAHDGASGVYDYYKATFGRNGIDNNDMTMVSSVHLGQNVANAYWTGSQMLYGDGDGQQLDDLTLSYEVIGHELTHGVTQHTANLIYQNASGALNEAWSDILGATAKAYKFNAAPDWLLAKESYTPNTPGDAMRYMDNPTKDNYSRDWWPDRIAYTDNPNNQNDRGGVHGNSGIANLAFVLTVQGGSHPRGKSSAQVTAIGLDKAEQIYYRALTTYMTQSTNFAGARTATAQAAQDLYGAEEKKQVETAWCAVGVGACPGDDNNNGSNVLQNGVAVTGLAASTGQDVVYTLDVPAGASDISFTSSGGTGDADMYVKFGSTPTDSSYDCRPYASGNNESCTGTQTGGTYYVRLKAYSSFSGVSLTGSYSGGGSTGPDPISGSLPNISVGAGQWSYYYQDLGTGYSNLTIGISGGWGDVDMYVKHGSQPTATSFDCRPYKSGNNETCTASNPASGRWNIGLYGYATSGGVTLSVSAN